MLTDLIRYAFANFGLTLFILAMIIAMVQRMLQSSISPTPTAEIFFRWLVLLPMGVCGLINFIMHGFYPIFTAMQIGWQNSPFQWEVAVANLGFGVLGILAFKNSFGFRMACVIGVTCWLWGDAAGHIYQMVTQNNFASGNAGSWLWLDIFVPLFLMALLIKIRKFHVASCQ